MSGKSTERTQNLYRLQPTHPPVQVLGHPSPVSHPLPSSSPPCWETLDVSDTSTTIMDVTRRLGQESGCRPWTPTLARHNHRSPPHPGLSLGPSSRIHDCHQMIRPVRDPGIYRMRPKSFLPRTDPSGRESGVAPRTFTTDNIRPRPTQRLEVVLGGNLIVTNLTKG